MKMRYKVKLFLLDGHIPLEESYERLSGTGPVMTATLQHRGNPWPFSLLLLAERPR